MINENFKNSFSNLLYSENFDSSVDFGARFIKPPSNTTSNSDSAINSENSSFKSINNEISLINLLSNLTLPTPKKEFSELSSAINICSTPIPDFDNYNDLSLMSSNLNKKNNVLPLSLANNSWVDEKNSNKFLNYGNKSNQFTRNFYNQNSSLDDSLNFEKSWQDLNKLPFSQSAYIGDYINFIHRQAKSHRNAAYYSNATCTWSGILPTKIHRNPSYSTKVFLGGVPWDITDAGLIAAFAEFGNIKIQWPGKDIKCATGNSPYKPGYVYIIFENDQQVKSLLSNCTCSVKSGEVKWFFKLPSKRTHFKEVQVVPWITADTNYTKNLTQRLDPNKTVFVGALHGMITADILAKIMNDLFGNVIHVGIDTDGKGYPLGSARCVFLSTKSYMKAISAGFINIRCSKFKKKIQVDPYLESSVCYSCKIQQGPVFCRSLACLKYFCVDCFYMHHSQGEFKNHCPMMRTKREV